MKELQTVNLTSNQKRVIAKIMASPTPKVAGEEISGDQNLVAARNELARLGALQYAGTDVTLTDIGQRLAQEDNIADASGQLTPDGQALAYTDAAGKEDKDNTQQPPMTAPAGVPPAPMGGPAPAAGMGMDLTMSHTPKYEPLQLLCELIREDVTIVEPSGEKREIHRTPHQYLQDLVKNLKQTGHSRTDIIRHIHKHKELRVPEEDEEKNKAKEYIAARAKRGRFLSAQAKAAAKAHADRENRSYQKREEQRQQQASRKDRLRKPDYMSWGDYYKSL